MRFNIKTLAMACILASPFLYATPHAQASAAGNWPDKPITLVVPYPPGGTTDIVGRHLARRLNEELGVTVIIENKAGAATTIGTSYVARSRNDGYTLLLSAGTTFTTNPHMSKSVPYKLEDFAPVAAVVTVPFAFVVRKDFPADNVKEFVSYAKAHPNQVNNATNGQGTMVHLLGELMASGLGVQLTQIHYKGASPASVDLIGGIVDSNIEALANAVPNINAGKYRALAVLSTERLALMPDVPTFRELGYPSVTGETWFAVFAPAGTPEPVIEKLNAVLQKVTTSEAYGEAMRKLGNDPKFSTPAELQQITLQQSQEWGELIERLHLKPK